MNTIDSLATPLIRKLNIFKALTDVEREYLKALEGVTRTFSRGDQIIRQGDSYGDVYIAARGWASRERHFEDGRRQIVNFILPGDFVSFHACLFRRSAHTVRALTPFLVARITRERMLSLFSDHPTLGIAICWVDACEKSILEERLASLGRRSAYERMAHLLLELWRRLELLDLTADHTFGLPISQGMMADALGLSHVHVNRTLKRLQASQLIRAGHGSGRYISILDLAGLEKAARFDEGYFHFTELRTQ